MKCIRFMMVMMSVLMLSLACSKQESEQNPQAQGKPELKALFDVPVLVENGGGAVNLEFSIENKRQDGLLSATSSVSWVKFEIEGDVITALVEPCDTPDERQAQVRVSYIYSIQGSGEYGELLTGEEKMTFGLRQLKSEGPDPVLKANFDQPLVVPSQGKELNLEFLIENPREEGVLSASTPAEWLAVSVQENIVTVKVSENKQTEERSQDVKVVYTYNKGKVEMTFSIRQNPGKRDGESLFDIQILSTSAYALKAAVTPADEDLFYVAMAVDKAAYESYGNEDQYVQDEINYFKAMADAFGQTVREVLDDVGGKGYMEVTIEGIPADIPTYFYVYGITYDENPVVLTTVKKIEFQTTE